MNATCSIIGIKSPSTVARPVRWPVGPFRRSASGAAGNGHRLGAQLTETGFFTTGLAGPT